MSVGASESNLLRELRTQMHLLNKGITLNLLISANAISDAQTSVSLPDSRTLAGIRWRLVSQTTRQFKFAFVP